MWYPDNFTFVPGETPLTSIQFLPVSVRRIQRYNNLLIGIYSAITFVLINILAYRDGRFSSWNQLVCHRPTPTGVYALL
ncbi:unnamed protein product, partial [Adineta steineri]